MGLGYTHPVADQAPLTLSHLARVRSEGSGGAFTVGLEGGGPGEVFRLDEAALAVLTLFDGLRSPADVGAEAVRRGMPIAEASVRGLAEALVGAGVLVPSDNLPMRTDPEARVHCAACGNCCHLIVGPLTDTDIARVRRLDWGSKGLEEPEDWLRTEQIDGRAERFLRHGDDDACVFLDPDNLCRIHKHFGAAEKPDACRLFPLAPVRRHGEVLVGLTYEGRGMREAGTGGGIPVAEEASLLAAVIARAGEGYPVLPEVDVGGLLWGAVTSLPAEAGAADALGALANAVLPTLEEGEATLASLLDDLITLASDARDEAPTTHLRRYEQVLLDALEALRSEGVEPLEGALPLAAEGQPFLVRFIRNTVFIGEPMGRLGVAAGVAVVAITCLAALGIARGTAASAGQAEVGVIEAGEGLSFAVGGLRCLERIDSIDGAGATLVREVLAALGGIRQGS